MPNYLTDDQAARLWRAVHAYDDDITPVTPAEVERIEQAARDTPAPPLTPDEKARWQVFLEDLRKEIGDSDE